METRSLTLALLLAPCALASTLSAAGETPRTLKTHFSYQATVPAAPAGTRTIDLWLPIPSDGEYQRVSNLNVRGPSTYRITSESKFGNRMVYVKGVSTPMVVTVSFDVERKEINLRASGGNRASQGELAADLKPDTMVPVGGRYAEMAKEVTGASTTTIDKMRALFDHTIATMQYDYKKESPHLGDGDVAFVCDYKKGNCSDLHSYIISLARSEGIPAYLEYGFPLTGIPVPSPVPASGKIGGYHCWIWFYDEGQGWLPLDASDGRRWLDSGMPAVKDTLVGSLVLERSAVALSKGRDITLNPPQNAPPLNNFIYPYAEADGHPIEAKWELSYELQSTADQGDLAKQVEDLRKMVLDQQKEIDALKAGKTATPAPPVAAKSGESINVYGFIRTDVIHDGSLANPNAETPYYINSPASTGGVNHQQFNMHPRLTRIGLDFNSPASVGGWKVTGKAEVDFQGGGSESRPNLRGRHLWLQFAKGPSAILFGQTWDVISPLMPSPNDDTVMWNAGNLGDRRPQIRYTYDNKVLTGAVALGLTGAVDAQDLDNNGVRDGEQSGVPNVQARLGWRDRQANVGIWGHVAAEKTTAPINGRTHFQSQSVGTDVSVRITPMFDLKGELWTGRDLSDFRGGIGQGVNATTGHEIMSSGGWGELGVQFSKTYRAAFGYSLDDPRDADVPTNGRTRNYAWYVANKWNLGPIEFGLNYLYWTTDYKGLSRGIDNRLNFYVIHRF